MMTAERNDTPMTVERLQQLLDAYGANPERWPADRRSQALELLAESAPARALRAEAARLDALLDMVPAAEPSPQLVRRALSAAPSPSPARARAARSWRRVAFAAVPLAAAAAALFYLVPAEVSHQEPLQFAIEDLGVYTTPTDLLLVPPGLDLSGSTPSLGCETGALGCPELAAPEPGQDARGAAAAKVLA
jgi:hypothetical protein